MRRLVAVGISCLVLSLADARAQESGGRPYYAVFASGDHDVVSMLIRSPEEIDPAVYVFATGLRAANRDGAGLPDIGGRYDQGNAEMDVGTLFDDDLISTGRTELILPGAR